MVKVKVIDMHSPIHAYYAIVNSILQDKNIIFTDCITSEMLRNVARQFSPIFSDIPMVLLATWTGN